MNKIATTLALTAVAAATLLVASNGILAAGFLRTTIGTTVSLNPQPLPPREQVTTATLADKVTLNPQPLPPKVFKRAPYLNLGDAVSINPQPLPPRVLSLAN